MKPEFHPPFTLFYVNIETNPNLSNVSRNQPRNDSFRYQVTQKGQFVLKIWDLKLDNILEYTEYWSASSLGLSILPFNHENRKIRCIER